MSDTSHVTVCLRSLALLCVCVCVYRVLCAVYCGRVACPVSVHMHICIRIRVRIPYSHLATRHSPPAASLSVLTHSHSYPHPTRSHTTRSICTLVAHTYIHISFLSNVPAAALVLGTPDTLAQLDPGEPRWPTARGTKWCPGVSTILQLVCKCGTVIGEFSPPPYCG